LEGFGSGSALKGNLFEEVCDDVIAGESFHPRVVFQNDTVAQDGRRHEFDVLKAGVRALVYEGAGPGGGCKGERGAGAGSILDVLAGIRLTGVGAVNEARDIVGDHFGQEDAASESEHATEGIGIHDGLHFGLRSEFAVIDDTFEGANVIAGDFELEEEAVELSFRERVGAFQFDGILGGENEEGIWKGMGLAKDRHATFLHRFEKRGLRFGRGAVDLVRKDDVCEDGAGLEDELTLAIELLEHRVARDVPGEQVGRELDALGIEEKGLGKAFDQFCFAETGESFEEDMASGKDSGDDQFDEFFLTKENLVQGVEEGPDVLAGVSDFGFRGVLHG